MTQEEKLLLLKDLCARLPYKVKAKDIEEEPPFTIIYFDGCDFIDDEEWEHKIESVKPYLRPMDDMTEEEEEELRLLKNQLVDCNETNDEKFNGIISEIHNLYFSHHLDFMGLIPKGLALEAPKDMYNTNNE